MLQIEQIFHSSIRFSPFIKSAREKILTNICEIRLFCGNIKKFVRLWRNFSITKEAQKFDNHRYIFFK